MMADQWSLAKITGKAAIQPTICQLIQEQEIKKVVTSCKVKEVAAVVAVVMVAVVVVVVCSGA